MTELNRRRDERVTVQRDCLQNEMYQAERWLQADSQGY
jgi:hypothetical protein